MSKAKRAIARPSDAGAQELPEDIIRIRAYQLFEQRGCEHGYDVEDWLQAEAEVRRKKTQYFGASDITRKKRNNGLNTLTKRTLGHLGSSASS